MAARSEFDHEYPPAEWTRGGIAAALRTSDERYPLPRYDDESVWASVRADDAVRGIVTAARERAAEVAAEPVVALPASGYLQYERTGSRGGYPDRRRRQNLSALVLAECLDREGEYVDPVLDHVWAICEQSTWTLPPHLSASGDEYLEGLPRPVSPEDHAVELLSAGAAKLLAEVDYVLGDLLHPAARERVRDEIDRRVLTPYLATDDFGWLDPPASNHNAVCNASALVAALHAEQSADRQAAVVAKAVDSLRHYLGGFDADGCTAEGVHYWKYGFGFYTMAARHLETRTGGEYSLFSPPVVERIATFPLRVELSPTRFPAFSDADEREDLTPYISCALGQHLGDEALAARGRRDLRRESSVGYFSSSVRNLAWSRYEAVPDPPDPPVRSFFAGQQWWVVRADPGDPDGPVVAAKGGHNDEPHNHNDCGSFVYHCTRESLLTDPGPADYESGYFGEERYESLAARSLGHSVPLVNGHEQAAGRQFAATVLDRCGTENCERLLLDLTDCYPDAAGLDALHRTFLFDRTSDPVGRLTVRDEAGFRSGGSGHDLTEVLVSHAPMHAEDGRLVVSGERSTAAVETGMDAEFDVERIDGETRRDPVWRARVDLPATGPNVTAELRVEPDDAARGRGKVK